MRLHRFFIGTPLTEGPMVVADPALCHQWSAVLRLKTGDRVILCDGKGMQAEAVLETLTGKNAVLRAEKSVAVAAEPVRRVTLACAVLKRENFEWVVQKATEAGIARIVPLITTRTVKTGLKMDRILRIATEAAEQSGRGTIPSVEEPVAFEAFLKNVHMPAVFFDCGGSDEGWTTAIAKPPAATCIVGPEGGWTEEEAALAKKHGCVMGSLGALTLRAETAAIIAAYRTVHGC